MQSTQPVHQQPYPAPQLHPSMPAHADANANEFDVEKVAASESPGAVSADPKHGHSINDIIVTDHREFFKIYRKLRSLEAQEKAGASNPEALQKEQRKWANQLIFEIARHSASEEVLMYPRFEKVLDDGEHLAQAARDEHSQVQRDLHDLDTMKDIDATFRAKLDKIMSELKEHIRTEETVDLVQLKQKLSVQELEQLGKNFQWLKKMGPTHPHPAVAPSRYGTLEGVIGMATAPLDKLRDMLRDFPTSEEIEQVLSQDIPMEQQGGQQKEPGKGKNVDLKEGRQPDVDNPNEQMGTIVP